MKKDNLIWWVIGGIGAYALYRYYHNKPKVVPTFDDSKVLDIVVAEEANQYPEQLQTQYNIVLPVDMVSKKVKAKGEELRSGRYAIQPQRINNPLSL
jgi:DNA gyrase inhibitor GyrI